MIIHKKTGTRFTWDYRSKDGWGVGVAAKQYRCQRVVAKDTNAEQVSDTAEFCHQHITQSSLTSNDRVLYGMHTLTVALREAPTIAWYAQLTAIPT